MAFNDDKIIKIGNLAPADVRSPSLQFWEYTTADTLAVTKVAGYFNDWRKYLVVGDIIMVKTANGIRHLAVATNPVTGNVTVTDVTGSGKTFIAGVHVTVAASDTKVTGLTTVEACGATLSSDPVDDPFMASATIGDQAGAPAAGSILLKTWKNTGGADPTPLAATTFGKSLNWWAYGTL